jgi:hypothetical protein
MRHNDASIQLHCECVGTCAILCVDCDKFEEDKPQTWTWDFYTNSGYEGSWRHRWQVIWSLLRGKQHFFHGTIHTVEDMERLQKFLAETLPK